MKESTKKKLKTTSLFVGGFLGSCASTYACSLMTAICPPVGIPATIGRFVISSMIAEKTGEYAWDTMNEFVECYDTVREDVKDAMIEMVESKEEESNKV